MKVLKHPSQGVLYTALHTVPAERAGEQWEEMSEAELSAWVSAELASGWQPIAQNTDTPIAVWRVSKDTLITRVVAANALPQVMAAMAQQSAEDQFVFLHSAWFHSDNARLRGLCAALNLDADALLAPDPYFA